MGEVGNGLFPAKAFFLAESVTLPWETCIFAPIPANNDTIDEICALPKKHGDYGRGVSHGGSI
jgi:hypothetical protein